MDLKTSHARTQSQIALEKATQSVQYKVSTVEWSASMGAVTQNAWYYKQQDEANSNLQNTGLTTAEPLLLDFTSAGAKSFATIGDTLVPEACKIKNAQIIGTQQGGGPGDRTCEVFIGYVPYTPGTPVDAANNLMVSLGTQTAVFEDNWKLSSEDLTTFNDKAIPKNSLLYILIRMTSAGPTNTCSLKVRFELERKVCSCA